MAQDRHPLFMPLILVGGPIFGFGLGFSQMARPEVVLDFLQFEDFGLLFVMFGAAIVSGIAFALVPRIRDSAPLTGDRYERRLKSFDRNVLVGGAIFGVGWGCRVSVLARPTPASAPGTSPSLWAIAGMFVGAYLQGRWRSRAASGEPAVAGAD